MLLWKSHIKKKKWDSSKWCLTIWNPLAYCLTSVLSVFSMSVQQWQAPRLIHQFLSRLSDTKLKHILTDSNNWECRGWSLGYCWTLNFLKWPAEPRRWYLIAMRVKSINCTLVTICTRAEWLEVGLIPLRALRDFGDNRLSRVSSSGTRCLLSLLEMGP